MLYIIIRYYYGRIFYVNVSKYNICVPILSYLSSCYTESLTWFPYQYIFILWHWLKMNFPFEKVYSSPQRLEILSGGTSLRLDPLLVDGIIFVFQIYIQTYYLLLEGVSMYSINPGLLEEFVGKLLLLNPPEIEGRKELGILCLKDTFWS